MGILIIGSAAVIICSNVTLAKIVASTGVILHIVGLKSGKQLAIGAGVIYLIVSICTGLLM
ncbi:MAG: hypothetical protein ACRDDX_10665 [Cellulosilyticaceae bacterium]